MPRIRRIDYTLDIPDELSAGWRNFIDEKLHATLAPLHRSVNGARVRFEVLSGPQPAQFECTLRGRSENGVEYCAQSRNTNGYLAVVNALARARSEIRRQRRRAGTIPPAGRPS